MSMEVNMEFICFGCARTSDVEPTRVLLAFHLLTLFNMLDELDEACDIVIPFFFASIFYSY